MLRLELLPACEGDCLILSWGTAGEVRRILVDGGRLSTAAHVLAYAERHALGDGAFELFVITHIDRDHIEGAVKLLRNERFRTLVNQVWFNGRGDLDYGHVRPGFETFGALDGERITSLLAEHGIPFNREFAPAPVAVQDDALPRVELPGGLTITLLSPDQGQLAALARPWDETLAAAPEGWELLGEEEPIDVAFLAARPFRGDTAKPNGSSIAFAAEYEGRHVLLTGDAHAERLCRSLAAYRELNPALTGFALVKAPHHGSRANVSPDLVQAVNCPHWAISTNGTQFNHPDAEAIARILVGSPEHVTITFNYESEETRMWRRPLSDGREFQPVYGQDGLVAIDIA